MVIKTYFDKDNVIMNLSNMNTGRNPISELFYGGGNNEKGFSRYIFSFDKTRLIEFHENNVFADLSKIKHVLKMTNTGSFDKNLINGIFDSTKERTSSFDLIVFPVIENFDEGVGYDYNENNVVFGDRNIDYGASNWFNRTTLSQWATPGIYSSGSQTILGTQHFDQGNENLEIDVTDYVNSIITGTTNPYMGVAFSTSYEYTETVNPQYVGFFSKDTNTFFEPYIETTYSNPIKDDRFSFYLDKVNCLVLYSNIGGTLKNLDQQPIVNIYDQNDDLIFTITSTTLTTGVYSVCFEIPSSSAYTDCTLFRDEWTNISYNGINRPNVNNEFQIIDSMSFFSIGNNFVSSKNFNVSVNGIKIDERIVRGDIRKLEVLIREEYSPIKNNLLDNVYYRLYIREGKSEYTVIDYQEINRTNSEMFFLLDTNSLIPNTYYLDVKIISGNEVSILKNKLNFDIVNISNEKER